MFGNEEVKSWAEALFLGLFYSALAYFILGLVVIAIAFLIHFFGQGVTLAVSIFVTLVVCLTIFVKDNRDKDTQELTEEHPYL